MGVKTGEVFQRAKVRDEITRLTEVYGAKGYAFTDVNPVINPDAKTKTAGILFQIKEGDLIRIREIRITGNDKTRDNVIRRELRVNEQEIIDTVAMKRSFQRLNNLNFFETVEILPETDRAGQGGSGRQSEREIHGRVQHRRRLQYVGSFGGYRRHYRGQRGGNG